MNGKADPKGRLQLIVLAAIFFGPLIVAVWMYVKGDALQPEGRTNHGVLLEPIVAINDVLPTSAISAYNEAFWLLVYVNDATCDQACRDALYTIRQSRLMLGREMDRVQRVFLHGEIAPDKVFLDAEHDGLIVASDSALMALLDSKRPQDLASGGVFLVDPLSNLVLYFSPDIDPADMVDDIKHLLRLSRIG